MNALSRRESVAYYVPHDLVRFEKVSSIEDRLFETATMHGISKAEIGTVQIVSSNGRVSNGIASMLRDQGIIAYCSSKLDELNPSDVLFVDIDALGDLLNVTEQLRAMRLASPSLITIILSESFRKDDYQTSRLSVCDASLKLPVSFPRLEQALMEADLNNMVWQDLCKEP